MSKLRAIVIDDEADSIENITQIIKQFGTSITVVGSDQTVLGGLKLWKNLCPDLIFLDVELKGGTGFDIYELAKDYGGKVVFFTAHEQYAIQALKAGATDYLLKPLDIDDLKELESRLIQAHTETEPSNSSPNRKIAFPISNGYRYLESDEILLVKADRSYSSIHLIKGEQLLISKNISAIERLLDSDFFYRCHKSYLINLGQVSQYTRADGGVLTMSDGTEVPVARDKKHEVLDKVAR